MKNRKVKALPVPLAPGKSLEGAGLVAGPLPVPKQAAKAKSPPPKAGQQELGPLEFRLRCVFSPCAKKELLLQI